ncbi:hypothetical protein JCM10207_005348 [Rhodosporidiobolus poonsookiae]
MAERPSHYPGWPDPPPVPQAAHPLSATSDGSSTETAVPPRPALQADDDPAAWSWPYTPAQLYGGEGIDPTQPFPTSAENSHSPAGVNAFDFGNPSYWQQPPPSSSYPPTSTSPTFGNDGVTLSMLDLNPSLAGPSSAPPLGAQQPFNPFISPTAHVQPDLVVDPTMSSLRGSSLDRSAPFSVNQTGSGAGPSDTARKHLREQSDSGSPDVGSGRGSEKSGSGSGSGSSKSGNGNGTSGGTNGAGAAAVGAAAAGGGGKMTQKADKSCKKCRERRVRCDRHWPTCDRCKKRREHCDWSEGTHVEDIEEGGDAERIAELTAKVSSLERQLKAGTPASTKSSGAIPLFGSSSSAFTGQQRPGTSGAFSTGDSPPLPGDNSGAGISAAVQRIWGTGMRMSAQEQDTLVAFLMGHAVNTAELGKRSLTWRLGELGMAVSLTGHLLDAALYACCSELPGIKPLADRVDYYKTNLKLLSPAEQCHVAVLCALGARASPHSQLLGMSTIALQDGTPSPPLYLFAGERREMACRQLEERARELCWQYGIIVEPDLAHLDALVGLVQLLIYEEVLPNQSRFFLRNAVGMYQDIRVVALDRDDQTSRDPRHGPGAALFLADAVIAAASSRPSYITTGELDLYFVSDGVPVPDFPGSELRKELNDILQRPLTRDKLSDALVTASLWVCGCARLFAQLTTARRPGAASSLPLLKNLWTLIDKVHHAVQELQQLLVSLTAEQVTGCEGDRYALEHFVLLGVRFDSILVDVINLMHVYLFRNRNGPGTWSEKEDDELLMRMRQESELRVRKCLKLSAFYAQLYLQSQDKHLVHHMLMQLEMLPEWTDMAAQRIGEPNGPTTDEFELTLNELDWLQQALELSSYYTPKAAHRLEKIAQARAQHESPFKAAPSLHALLRQAPNPVGPLPTVDSLNAQQAAIESHQPTNEHYHYDLPPHSINTIRAVNPPNDPSHLYRFDVNQLPTPSQLYVFDQLGVPSQQGLPLSSSPAVPSLDFVQHSFRGQNWMDRAGVYTPYMPPPSAEVEMPQLGTVPVGEASGPGQGMEWMRSAGSTRSSGEGKERR